MTSPLPPGAAPALAVAAELLPRFDEILTPNVHDRPLAGAGAVR